MKVLIYSIHLIASIGGGFLGLTSFLSLEEINGVFEIAFVLIFAGLYASGIIGGILFSLNKEKKTLLKLFYFLQIPLFSSVVFSYQFLSAFGVYVGYNLFQTQSSVFTIGFHAEWLSTWHISWNQGRPFVMGVNLVACLLLCLLCMMDYSNLEMELNE